MTGVQTCALPICFPVTISVAVLPSTFLPSAPSNRVMAIVSSAAPDSNSFVVNPSDSNSVVTYASNSSGSSRFVNINSDLYALKIDRITPRPQCQEIIQLSDKNQVLKALKL